MYLLFTIGGTVLCTVALMTYVFIYDPSQLASTLGTLFLASIILIGISIKKEKE